MADDISSTFTLDIEDLVAKLNESASKVSETADKMHESFGGVGESLEHLKGAMETAFEAAGIYAAYEAMEKLVDIFKEGAEQATEMEHASMRLGITIAEYQGLELAADKAGVGMDRLTRAGVMLDAKLTAAREGNKRMAAEFEAAGVSASELADKNYRGADALVTFGQNAENTAVQMQLIGVRNSEVMAVLPQLAGGFDQLADAAAAHGAITEEQAEKLHELHSAFAVAEFETKNYKLALLSDLAPAMEAVIEVYQEFTKGIRDLSNYFMEQAGPVLHAVWDGFKTLGDIFEQNSSMLDVVRQAWKLLMGDLSFGEFIVRAIVELFALMAKAALEGGEVFYEFGRTVQQIGEKLGVSLASLSETASKAFHLDFSGAADEWRRGTQALIDIDKKAEDDILKSRKEMAAKLLAIDLEVDLPEFAVKKPKEKEERKERTGELPKLGKQDNDDAELDQLRLELEFAQKGSEEKVDLAYRVAGRMADISKGTAKEQMNEQKVILSALKERYEEQKRLAEENAKADRDEQTEGLKFAQKTLDEEYKAHEISAEDYQQLSDRISEAELQSQETYLAKMEELNQKDEIKLRALAAERVKVQNKATDEIAEHTRSKNQEILKSWEGITQPIAGAFGNMFKNMIVDRESFGQAFRKLEGELLQDAFNSTLKMAENWLATELAKTAASEAGGDARAALDEVMSALGITTDKAAAESTIATSAAEGAANAMAATSAIPIIGPELAPEAGAAMYASILAWSAPASAEGGFDVPAGVNPLTQLHQKEMVLPEKHANVIRNMAEGGGGDGASPSFNFNISAMDSNDVGKFFERHGPRIVRSLHNQVRNFNTPLHAKQ